MYERIVQTASELILSNGFRKFTVEEVAAELGISKKTIYKYFASKREIISASIDDYMKKEYEKASVVSTTTGNWMEKLERLCSIESGRRITTALLAELQKYYPEEWDKVEQMHQFMSQIFMQLLVEGVEAGDIRRDANLPMVALIMKKTAEAILDYDFLSSHDLTINHAFQQLDEIILYGILTRNTDK